MEKVKIAYASTHPTDLFPLILAFREIIDDVGDVAELQLRSGEDLMMAGQIEEFVRIASKSHLVILHLHGGKKSLACFDDLVSELEAAGVPIHAQATASEQDTELYKRSTVDKEDYRSITRYLNYGGKENFKGLLLYLAHRFGGFDCAVPEPERPIWDGIYHPDFDHVPTLDEYLEQRHAEGRPTVGIWFYNGLWQSGNTAFMGRLIAEIEGQGANVIPVFMYSLKDVELGTHGAEWVMENYFMKDGQPIVDVLISLLMFSLSMWASGDDEEGLAGENATDEAKASEKEVFLTKLGVPVIKGIMTHKTEKEWTESIQGLSPMDVTTSIALPEFDGLLITVPVAARERTERDPLTGAKATIYMPIEERVGKIVRLSLNWARLRHIPSEEKRVAIIFHNYPPRDDRIGSAFGLDSPVSVWNILRDMEAEGYRLDRLPEDGRTLIEEVRDGVTNNRQWSSPVEMATRAVDTVSGDLYRKWFCELPAEVQNKMTEAWGPPPGDLFVHEDRLIIPGIINGNVFIGLQPPRGFLEDPAAIYHSPDHPIPHHYYAYYRWIRDVFGANLVMHIGKHGSLEWLPGKGAGLSSSCFPDIAISDLPNIYPYIINNPGEGTQAKRRSYCCIIDHLVPVMHNADTYEEMAELEVLFHDYQHVVSEDPGKTPDVERRIWEKVSEAKLDHDLMVDEVAAFSDFDSFLDRLHDYIHEMADTQIRDGLHIFGEPPEGSRLDEFLVALTRLSNGNVPSMRESMAELLGYDYDELLRTRGQKGGHIIEEVHDLSLKLVERFHQENFRPDVIEALEDEVLGKRSEKMELVLDYMGRSLVPRIRATTDELTAVLSASRGCFVPPGPSGAPTRGMADILPTGRNFYSVDPQAIPSPAAWKVGTAQGDALIERYKKDEGKYPESVGMVIWGTGTMRTKGDDVAEVLYLMGVRPVWEAQSGRVEGIELIPTEELGRPRIDVTLRISGLFRDAFSNIVALINEAVEMVADLDEPHELNYLAMHVAEDVKEKIAEGLDPLQAKEEACYRIFGCRPGAYGAGVSDAIDAKNWKDEHDLAEIYIKWGGYAYGRRNYGITVPDDFKRRLSRLDLTVKNEDTREYDMLDGDDFYSYHGGMIAAVKALKGELPRSYCGDSSDPDRVKTRSAVEETKHIFRARILNPKWIESMQRHGYKGAGDISRMVDIAFGWDATAEVLEDWMYEALANKYALDEKMQEWLKDVNPHALMNIAERLLEAIDREMWDASEEMREELRRIYLDVEGMLEDDSAPDR